MMDKCVRVHICSFICVCVLHNRLSCVSLCVRINVFVIIYIIIIMFLCYLALNKIHKAL